MHIASSENHIVQNKTVPIKHNNQNANNFIVDLENLHSVDVVQCTGIPNLVQNINTQHI